MKIAVIAHDPQVSRFLSAAGFSVILFHPDEVSSLTALLFDRPEICSLVIQDSNTPAWSASHVLAAAKHLEQRGATVLLGDGILTLQCGTISLIKTAASAEQIPDLLQRPLKPAAGGRSSSFSDKPVPATDTAPLQVKPKVRQMLIPPGKILMLGVIGSQPRIGCTTQAIGLWHYCKALGFDPAIIAASDQIAQLANVMECTQIDGGYKIDGIPFVSSAALAYDCYVLDIGAGSIQEAKKMTDCLVLVAGSKPWELQHTAAALRAAQGQGLHILLSYTSQKEAENLQPLFGGLTCAVAPNMTEPWLPCLEAMLVYDTLLRPALERLMVIDHVLQEDMDLELVKEEN